MNQQLKSGYSQVCLFMAVPLLILYGHILPDVKAQSSPSESDYYTISALPVPEEIILEAGGLAFNEQGQLMVPTRRGEVWMISDPGSDNPSFRRFGQGLHEPLGIAYRNDAYYIVQRGELTKLEDTNQSGIADRYETIYRWPLSGNYHEFSYGPKILPDGDMIVTLNLSLPPGQGGKSLVKWRGWMLRISETGEMTPMATGFRSPLGIGVNSAGDIFYTENQGDWIGSGWMTHLEEGDFAGHPAGLRWSHMPDSPIDLRIEDIDDSEGLTLYEQSKNIPELKTPAVWFPHTIMGISTSGILFIEDDEQVGPFAGQVLVGDFGHAKIMRVALEKVNNEYQGAVFGFREGFSSGVIKLEWGPDNTLYTAMTSRGWSHRATGQKPYGIERLRWNGEIPFEMHSIKAESNGFTIRFTKPVDQVSAMVLESYNIVDFTYEYDRSYGSPIIDRQDKTITGLDVAEDKMSVRLYVDGLREGYINEIKAEGVQSEEGGGLLHAVGYYALNNLPDGGRSAGADEGGIEADDGIRMEDSNKKITEMPAEWEGGPDVRIQLATEPGLRYDQEVISVKTGSRIAFTFNNDDDMVHNVVVTEPGMADEVGVAAMNLGLDADALEYVPGMDEVLYHSSMLQPGAVETIYFKVPETPGDYQFVCTFPGHYITMRGILRVGS